MAAALAWNKRLKDTRIALTKWNQSVGQREDHVEVRHAEQFLLSRGKSESPTNPVNSRVRHELQQE